MNMKDVTNFKIINVLIELVMAKENEIVNTKLIQEKYPRTYWTLLGKPDRQENNTEYSRIFRRMFQKNDRVYMNRYT